MASKSFDALYTVQSFVDDYQIFISSDEQTKDMYLGAIWTCSTLSGISQQNIDAIIATLSSRYSAHTFIQFATLGTPDIDDEINSYKKGKVQSTGLIGELVYRQMSHLEHGVKEPLVYVSGVKLHRKRLVITFKSKVKGYDDMALRVFSEQAERFAAGLNSANLNIKKVNEKGYIEIMRQLTHIFDARDSRYDESTTLSDQIHYINDMVEVKKNEIFFETGSTPEKNFYSKALSVKYFPEETSIAVMNYLIGDPRGLNNQITGPFYMVLTLHYPDQDEKKSAVEKKSTIINYQSWGSMGKVVPAIGYKKRGIDVLVDEIHNSSTTLVEANLTTWLFARTQKEVSALSEACRSYFKSLHFDMLEDAYILDALWSSTVPLNATAAGIKDLNRFHSMATSHAGQFLPIFGEKSGPKNPVIPLLTLRGEVGGFDLYSSQTNFNAIIAAASGSGKSYFAQNLVVNYLAENARVWVIDTGYSYKKLALSLGSKATFIELQPDKPMCFNPFSDFLDSHGGEKKDFDDELSSLVALFEKMVQQRDQLSDIAVSKLEAAIRSAFNDHQGHTTVVHVADYLSAQPKEDIVSHELAAKMQAFSHGQYRQWFDGEATINLNSDLVVLELESLKSQPRLKDVILAMLIQKINHQMYMTRGRKKILLIDEAWSLMDDPVMVKNLEIGFRVCRKHDGAMVIITQSIGDLYRSENTKAMIENAAWLLVLQQNESAVNDAIDSKRLSIEPYGQQMLKGIHTSKGNYSEVMIINNQDWSIYRLVLDRFTQVMYSTDGKERGDILDAIDKGEDVVEAIKRFIIGEPAWNVLRQIENQIYQSIEASNNEGEIKKMISEIV